MVECEQYVNTMMDEKTGALLNDRETFLNVIYYKYTDTESI